MVLGGSAPYQQSLCSTLSTKTVAAGAQDHAVGLGTQGLDDRPPGVSARSDLQEGRAALVAVASTCYMPSFRVFAFDTSVAVHAQCLWSPGILAILSRLWPLLFSSLRPF